MRQAMMVGVVVTAILTWGCARSTQPTPPSASTSTANPLLTADLSHALEPSMESSLVEQSAKKWDEACTTSTLADADAVALYGKACAASDGEGCAKLGMIYACGSGVQKNAATATTLFEKSCALRNATGCQMYGGALLGGNFGKSDVAQGLRVYQSACNEKGSANACGTVGSILMLFGRRDEAPRAIAFLEKACTGGVLDSCGNAAVLELNGMGSHEKNPGRAFALAKSGCEKANGFSCGVLGALYMTGAGVAKDEKTAVKLFTMSCDAGEASGCTYLGGSYHQGSGVPQDVSKAAELFRKGCEGGNGQACRVLAEMSATTAPSRSMPSAASPTMF
jgi:uncharacterized protein